MFAIFDGRIAVSIYIFGSAKNVAIFVSSGRSIYDLNPLDQVLNHAMFLYMIYDFFMIGREKMKTKKAISTESAS